MLFDLLGSWCELYGYELYIVVGAHRVRPIQRRSNFSLRTLPHPTLSGAPSTEGAESLCEDCSPNRDLSVSLEKQNIQIVVTL